MSVMLVVFVILAWSQRPSGIVRRVNLLIATLGTLAIVGFDLANRSVPQWFLYSLAGLLLALICVSIVRNEDGQRYGVMRWYLRIPPPG